MQRRLFTVHLVELAGCECPVAGVRGEIEIDGRDQISGRQGPQNATSRPRGGGARRDRDISGRQGPQNATSRPRHHQLLLLVNGRRGLEFRFAKFRADVCLGAKACP